MTTNIYPLNKYGGSLDGIAFNPLDFVSNNVYASNVYASGIYSNVISNSNNLTSASVGIINQDSTVSDTATIDYVDNAVLELKNTILGSTNLQTTLNSIYEIDQAINNDPQFYTNMTQSINNVLSNVNSLTSRVASDEISIQTNTSNISSLQSRLTTDESAISSNTSNITSNSNSITALQSRLTTDESNITSNSNSITALQSRLTTDEATITTNISNISSNTSSISTLNSSVQSLQTSFNSLNNNTQKITCDASGNTSINSNLNCLSIVDNGSLTCNNGINVVNGNVIFPINSINSNYVLNNSFVDLSGNQTITGVKTFNNLKSTTQTAGDNSVNVATTNYVDRAISNLIGGAPSTLDTLNEIATLLQTDSNNITSITNNMVDISSNQNISGTKTFDALNATTINLNGSDLTTTLSNFITNSVLSNYLLNSTFSSTISNYVSISTMNSTLANYVLSSNLTSTLSNYVLSSSLSSYATVASLNNYLTTTTATSTYQTIANMSSYVTSSSLATSLSSYALTSSLSSYATVSSLSSYAPINNTSLTGTTTVNECIESIYNATVSSNALSYAYTNGGIFYCAPSSATNMSLALTSVPTTTYRTVTITAIINTGTYKQYFSSITINGTSYTLIYIGGSANVSVSSASLVYQQFYIHYLSSSTPSYVSTSISQAY